MKFKKYIILSFGFIGIFCIIYYFNKFYNNTSLGFERNTLYAFIILSVLIIISLISSAFNYLKLDKVEKQNKKLLNQVDILYQQIEKYHYSEMKSINSNMECILDLEKGEE